MIVLAEWDDPTPAAILVEDDLGFVPGDASSQDELERAVRRARVYAGHAGWGPGQLEDEVAEDAWIIEAPRPRSSSPRPGAPLGRGAAPQGAGVRAALDDATRPEPELTVGDEVIVHILPVVQPRVRHRLGLTVIETGAVVLVAPPSSTARAASV